MQVLYETFPSDPYFPFGYPVSERAWSRFRLDDAAGSGITGGAASVRAARLIADRINISRDFSRPDERPARAGELLTMGLIEEILRYLADLYCEEVVPHALQLALTWTRERAGADTAERPLRTLVDLFPPQAVRIRAMAADEYLRGASGPWTHQEVAVREAVLLHLTNHNPAMRPYRVLFDDSELAAGSPYTALMKEIDRFNHTLPPHPLTGLPLLDTLRAPMQAAPDSLEAQLDFIRSKWAALLPARLMERIQLARGILAEETAFRGMGPGESRVLDFRPGMADVGYPEPEAFTPDRDWMPNVVLLAKTVYVWLDQLSKQYARPIHRLDEIPDEELDKISRWGFTSLWLIGLWERSAASQTIKQIMGNPEAAASAYSLYDYTVAHDLGGDAAYRNLAERAWRRGIRLASDMVPNHVGIYSKWVVEHPDWFIQLRHPPFPSYQFTGADLSSDPRVGLFIEDGYWTHRDAAVVFKRVDRWTGDTRYIYHGNDGTSMPWNDTAQLNYLLPEVREAVIQTILHVARQFPVIRFDAAMTLAKRHYQRLWFPQPGDAGAVPSRAEHGMSREAFDRAFPAEFWREVVDRIAVEAPDTLLLAEAFWLMEGYFVRTLGMHRVYNSAFMNMLKLEDNSKYRQTIKNVLEFSPEVLQRFVNFMNNPDEDTAEAQFGKGDKYFGVAVLLVTMPGLPMLGHGQIEGYTEKYGMEYRRAYRDESIDAGLVRRHEAEIFPLMRRRHLFSGARHFALYDFVTPEGWVDENVFAYSNRSGADRGVILYNNAYSATRGSIHLSCAVNEGPADAPSLRRIPISEALGLNTSDTCYYVYRDHRSGLEYLRHAQRISKYGLHVEFAGYQYCALIDWREVHDLDHSWGRLDAMLAGQGVASVEEAYQELHLAPLLDPFRAFFNEASLRLLARHAASQKSLGPVKMAFTAFMEAVRDRTGAPVQEVPVWEAVLEDLRRLVALRAALDAFPLYPGVATFAKAAIPAAGSEPFEPLSFWRVPLAWAALRRIGAVAETAGLDSGPFAGAWTSAAWLREWFLVKQVARAFEALDGDAWNASQDARLVRICVAHAPRLLALRDEVWAPELHPLFTDADVTAFLMVNTFNGRRWINKEQLERMMSVMFLFNVAALSSIGEPEADRLALALEDTRTILESAEDAGYDMDRMFESLK